MDSSNCPDNGTRLDAKFLHQLIAIQQTRRGDDFFGLFVIIFQQDACNVEIDRPGFDGQGMGAGGTDISQGKQDKVNARLAAIAEEAINGFARGSLLFFFKAVGEGMNPHVSF